MALNKMVMKSNRGVPPMVGKKNKISRPFSSKEGGNKDAEEEQRIQLQKCVIDKIKDVAESDDNDNDDMAEDDDEIAADNEQDEEDNEEFDAGTTKALSRKLIAIDRQRRTAERSANVKEAENEENEGGEEGKDEHNDDDDLDPPKKLVTSKWERKKEQTHLSFERLKAMVAKQEIVKKKEEREEDDDGNGVGGDGADEKGDDEEDISEDEEDHEVEKNEEEEDGDDEEPPEEVSNKSKKQTSLTTLKALKKSFAVAVSAGTIDRGGKKRKTLFGKSDENDDGDDNHGLGGGRSSPMKRIKLASGDGKNDRQDNEASVLAEVPAKALERTQSSLKVVDQEQIDYRLAQLFNIYKTTAEEIEQFTNNYLKMVSSWLFVPHVPDDATEEELRAAHPNISKVKLPRKRKKGKNFAFLNFESKGKAEEALKDMTSSPRTLGNLELKVQRSRVSGITPPEYINRRKLAIIACPKETTQEELCKLFPQATTVWLSRNPRSDTIENYLMFPDEQTCKDVLHENGTVTLHGKCCALFFDNYTYKKKTASRKLKKKFESGKHIVIDHISVEAPKRVLRNHFSGNRPRAEVQGFSQGSSEGGFCFRQDRRSSNSGRGGSYGGHTDGNGSKNKGKDVRSDRREEHGGGFRGAFNCGYDSGVSRRSTRHYKGGRGDGGGGFSGGRGGRGKEFRTRRGGFHGGRGGKGHCRKFKDGRSVFSGDRPQGGGHSSRDG